MQRRALITCAGLALLAWQRLARGATILAVRLWPAPDYSRITIESDTALKVRTTLVADPPRLAVDIDGVELDSTLRELVTKLGQDDPNIAGIRVGQNAPGVVRLVLDLKQAMAPQVFTLEPVAAYRHRLVFDLYPAQALDPLQALINERLKATSSPDPLGELIARHQAGSAPTPATQASIPTATQKIATTPITTGSGAPKHPELASPAASLRTAAPATERLIIIALDAGHGGEDPGAIGPAGTREKDVVLRLALRLRERINAAAVNSNPMRAFLTRDGDFFVPLHVRVEKARRVQADLFTKAAGCERVCPEPGRRLQHGSTLDGRAGEQGRLDRRPECQRPRRPGAPRPAGHEHHSPDQGQPAPGRQHAGRDRSYRQAAQTARRAGGFCGAEGT